MIVPLTAVEISSKHLAAFVSPEQASQLFDAARCLHQDGATACKLNRKTGIKVSQ